MKMISLCSAKVLCGRGSGAAKAGQDRAASKVVAGLALLALSACAAGQDSGPVQTSGGADLSRTVVIDTQPVGAVCTLSRNGRTLGVIAQTPEGIAVSPGQLDVDVTCSKNGYGTAAVRLTPTANGGVAGNLMVPGFASGIQDPRGLSYPGKVSVLLTPLRFDSETDRRRHFTFKRRELNARAEAAARGLDATCGGLFGCPQSRSDLDQRIAQRQRELQTEERSARVLPNR
jgi:hypothetical protein